MTSNFDNFIDTFKHTLESQPTYRKSYIAEKQKARYTCKLSTALAASKITIPPLLLAQ